MDNQKLFLVRTDKIEAIVSELDFAQKEFAKLLFRPLDFSKPTTRIFMAMTLISICLKNLKVNGVEIPIKRSSFDEISDPAELTSIFHLLAQDSTEGLYHVMFQLLDGVPEYDLWLRFDDDTPLENVSVSQIQNSELNPYLN